MVYRRFKHCKRPQMLQENGASLTERVEQYKKFSIKYHWKYQCNRLIICIHANMPNETRSPAAAEIADRTVLFGCGEFRNACEQVSTSHM